MYRLPVLVCFFYATAVVSVDQGLGQGQGDINENCFWALHISSTDRPSSHRIIDTRRNDIEFVQELVLSRHHIIPYATMRDFYNALINHNRAGFRQLFNQVINVAAGHILGRRLDLSNEQLPAMAEMVNNHLTADEVTDAMYTQEIYTWLPFNIYIGPNGHMRWDEAFENAFDTTAYAVIGRQLSNRLATVCRYMTSYLNSASETDLNFVIQEMSSLVSEYTTPFAFNRNNWVVRNRINQYEFALATATLSVHDRYRPLRDDEFCTISTTTTTGTPSYDLRRRRSAQRTCLSLLGIGNHDTCCINTLNILRQKYRTGNFNYNHSDNQIKVTNRSSGASGDTNTNNIDPPTYTWAGWFLRILTLGIWHS